MLDRIDKMIELENQLADALLTEAISNQQIQYVLHHIAIKIHYFILNPILTALSHSNVNKMVDLPAPFLASIEKLAEQNTNAEKCFGGIGDGYEKAEEITHSLSRVKQLLNAMEQCLLTTRHIHEIDGCIKVLKIIMDLSFCYFEYFEKPNLQQFTTIKDLIWLTPEELDSRVFRTELDKPQLALTYGIGTKPRVDLIAAANGIGMYSGKARFAGANLEVRLKVITKEFDELMDVRNELINQMRTNTHTEKQDSEFIKIERQFKLLLNKMQYYRIPVLKSAREPLSFYAKCYETTFVKLAKQSPLIANISRSTARTLISTQDLSAFKTNMGKFDFDMAQIFANLVTAFFVRGGHHSFIECEEIYNRLIDLIVLLYPEQLPKNIIPAHASSLPYIDSIDKVEYKLPYCLMGDHESFLHSSYAEKIIKQIKKNNTAGLLMHAKM